MRIYSASKFKIFRIFCLIVFVGVFFADSSDPSSLPDNYESDDSAATASTFYLFSSIYQAHNFHDQADEDWVKFYTRQDFDAVEIKTYEPEQNCETIITLFDTDKTTQLKEQRFTLSNGVNLMSFRPERDGTYYVCIKNKDSSRYGSDTGYNLSIYMPVAPFSGTVDGIASDSSTQAPVEGVRIRIENDYAAAVTESDGFYFLHCPAGQFTLYASKNGYRDYSTDIEVGEAERIERNISLSKINEVLCKIGINGAIISGTREAGYPLTFKITSQNSCSGTTHYRYSVHPDYGTSGYDGLHWQSMTGSEWVSDNSTDYTFTTQGKYIVVVWTAEDINNVDPNGIPIAGWSVNVNNDSCKTNLTGFGVSATRETNTPLTFTVTAKNTCSETLYYRFSVHPYYGTNRYDGTQWKSMTTTEWISANSVDYTFAEPGKYIVVVWATDDTSNVNPNGIPIIGWSVDIE